MVLKYLKISRHSSFKWAFLFRMLFGKYILYCVIGLANFGSVYMPDHKSLHGFVLAFYWLGLYPNKILTLVSLKGSFSIQTTTLTAMRISPNKKFNGQDNAWLCGCVLVLCWWRVWNTGHESLFYQYCNNLKPLVWAGWGPRSPYQTSLSHCILYNEEVHMDLSNVWYVTSPAKETSKPLCLIVKWSFKLQILQSFIFIFSLLVSKRDFIFFSGG